jgi:hypothetical protein
MFQLFRVVERSGLGLMTKGKTGLAGQLLGCDNACRKQMGIQQAILASGRTCPGPRHRDIGYRMQSKMGDRRSKLLFRAQEVEKDAEDRWNALGANRETLGGTPMLWDSNAAVIITP